MLVYLIGVVMLLIVVNIMLNHNERARLLKKIPGPRDDFLFGNALVLASAGDFLKLTEKFSRIWNGIYRLWVYPYGVVVIYNPDDVEASDEYSINIQGVTYLTQDLKVVCSKSAPESIPTIYKKVMSSVKYTDKSVLYEILKPWLRSGLLLSNGAKWHQRRKILTPAFHFNILRKFFEIILENNQRLLENLEQSAGQKVDVVPALSEHTLNLICETAMGTQLGKEAKDTSKSYKQAIYDLGQIFVHRFMNFYLYPDLIFYSTPLGRKQQKCLKIVHSFTEAVIEQRKKYNMEHQVYTENILADEIDDDESYMNKKKRKTAMLDLLISAEKEGLIDKIGIQEEVDTFMFEGHDTVSSGLTFCLLMLANYKNIQDKVVDELNKIFEDPERPIKMEDLSKMQYMECCIKETIRIYPPVLFVSRGLNEPITLSKYTIPSGTLCHISIRDLHRRSDLYEDPLRFDPDRFMPENSVGRHPYAFIPFSAGPRNCIGQRFAMMELKVTIAEVLKKFELMPVTRPEDIDIKPDIVLRNNGPVYIKFKKRPLY